MKKEITNIPASVRARLKKLAKESGRQLTDIFKYYAMERFLYRLGISAYADKFVLKGALMFLVWQVQDRRTTLDVDFMANFSNKIEEVEQVVREICVSKSINDGLLFDPDTVKGRKIKEDADYSGVRANFMAFLEKARIPVQIDFGFGDIIYPEPGTIKYPVLLDFPEPLLKGYTKETVISEKFEAMVKLGEFNSRMKDFYDVWLLIGKFSFKPGELAKAMQKTFEHRKTAFPEGEKLFNEAIYDEKSDRQALWKAFLAKNVIKNAPQQLATVAVEIQKFLSKPMRIIRGKNV